MASLAFGTFTEDICWWTAAEIAAVKGTRLGYLAEQYRASMKPMTAICQLLLKLCKSR